MLPLLDEDQGGWRRSCDGGEVTNASGALMATVAPGATVPLRGTKGQRYTFTATAIDVAGNVGTSTAVGQVK